MSVDEAHTWLQDFLASGHLFLEQIEELGDSISQRSATPADDDDLVALARRLREIADHPFLAELPVSWRLVHSLAKAVGKSLRGILEALARALEAGVLEDVPKAQEELQGHFDRAAGILPNFDFALAGLQVRGGVPMPELMAGFGQESIADAASRAEAFSRHYFSVDERLPLSADVAIALSMSAFFLESRDEPDRLQRIAVRLWKRLSKGRAWQLPNNLVDELMLAAERIQGAGQVIDALDGALSGILLDEEKARMAGRLAEEGLRPLLAVLIYLIEGSDNPSRYETLRLANLASLIAGLEPRLRHDEKFLAYFPIDYRHAYAHGAISNDGSSVIFELINPPTRVIASQADIEEVLTDLFDVVALLTPVLVLTTHLVMSPPAGQSLVPLRMVSQQAEILMALIGIESSAASTPNEIVVKCGALPARPMRLIGVAGGLGSLSGTRTLSIDVPGGPQITIPLNQIPREPPQLAHSVLLRYRVLKEWSTPSLTKADDETSQIDDDLVYVMASVLHGLLQQAARAPDEEKQEALAVAQDEAQAALEALAEFQKTTHAAGRLFRVATDLQADCIRALNSTREGVPPVPNDADLFALLLDLSGQGRSPTLFMGDM